MRGTRLSCQIARRGLLKVLLIIVIRMFTNYCVANKARGAEQGVILLAMYTAAKLHAHPFERAWLLLPFFLGAAEIASGVSGL